MSSREKLAGPAKIGNVQFWATSVSGGVSKNLAPYGGIGVLGETHDDLGRGAKTDQWVTVLDEAVYLQLEAIADRGEPVPMVHPLFGHTFTGRLHKITFSADSRYDVDATLTVVKEGYEERPPKPAGFELTAKNFQAAGVKFTETVEDWINEDLPATDLAKSGAFEQASNGVNYNPQATAVQAAIFGPLIAVQEFTAAIEGVLAADLGVEELSAAYSDLADVVALGTDAWDSLTSAYTELLLLPLPDSLYAMLDAAQVATEAAQQLSTRVWQVRRTTAFVTLDEIAKDFLNETSDEAIEAILAHNPTLPDLTVIPVGFELNVPLWS